MQALETDSVSWSADASGYCLTLRTPRARVVAESLKAGKTYTVEIKEYRKKRSLDANALYWKSLTTFAAALQISNARAHNLMIRHYGEPERYDDKLVYVVLPDTPEAEKKADEAETYHVKPTSQTREGNDGKRYRTYILMRGSSTYDTKEFSRLLSGLLDECGEMGLDVLMEREKELLRDK